MAFLHWLGVARFFMENVYDPGFSCSRAIPFRECIMVPSLELWGSPLLSCQYMGPNSLSASRHSLPDPNGMLRHDLQSGAEASLTH